MNLTIINERKQSKEQIIFEGTTLKELLKDLKINPETIIVTRNDEILLENDNLNDNDIITILSVISGG
jgi:sulfur carrier protein ThiS